MRQNLQPDRAPVVLRPRKRKTFGLLALSVVLAFICALAGASGSALGWAGAVLFTLSAVVAAVTLLPGAAYLRLEREGFVARSLFRTARLQRWER